MVRTPTMDWPLQDQNIGRAWLPVKCDNCASTSEPFLRSVNPETLLQRQ